MYRACRNPQADPDAEAERPHRIAGGSVSLRKPQCDQGVNLTVNPGEMIGLVGHSGSGKSTLVNLMCRFYDVSAGAILADGVDLRSMAVADYRANIGLVLQEPFLFFGTIAENIAYGKPGAGRDEIVAAARAAHAHEFILRLPRATIHWSASEDRGSRGRAPTNLDRQGAAHRSAHSDPR